MTPCRAKGFHLVQTPAETLEDLRKRHISLVPLAWYVTCGRRDRTHCYTECHCSVNNKVLLMDGVAFYIEYVTHGTARSTMIFTIIF